MIGIWSLVLYSPQSETHMKRSTGCIWIAICFTPSDFYVCFCGVRRKKKICLLT